MKIYAFEVDKATGICEAETEINGRRDFYCVWHQYNAYYIRPVGVAAWYLTPAQVKAFEAFMDSNESRREFPTGLE